MPFRKDHLQLVTDAGATLDIGWDYGTPYSLDPINGVDVDVQTAQGVNQVGVSVRTSIGWLNAYNPGALAVPFTATLKSDGAVVNPCVLNILTGQSIRILTTLTPGQVIEIYRTTTDKLAVKRTEDGTEENIFSLLDEDSDLLELAPGDNLLKATADSGETSLLVTVRFYPMVSGILPEVIS